MKSHEMRLSLLMLFPLFTEVFCQLLIKKENVRVLIGREVLISSSNLQFANSSDDSVCKVEVVTNEPMTQQVGLFEPQVCTYSICFHIFDNKNRKKYFILPF